MNQKRSEILVLTGLIKKEVESYERRLSVTGYKENDTKDFLGRIQKIAEEIRETGEVKTVEENIL